MLKDAKRIVFKVGTSTLTYKTGKANIRAIKAIAEVLSDIQNSGIQVVLVTSAAISIGAVKLGLSERPKDTPGRQAAATVGQCELMFLYDKFFGEYGNITGQLLLTKRDIDDDECRQNLTNAFERLFKYNAIPIINENDSVAVDEVVYGDNDNLSAHVAKLVRADALIILSDIDGMFTANPEEDDNAVLIPVVENIDGEIENAAGKSTSHCGTGGMATKITAAKLATEAGIDTVVMNGSTPEDIYKLLEGRHVGTVFKAK
ncbi:MAG: glutamate 5-kinase [Clostridiales bacterium]|nr:glutamate 5-kinase [Clostridiales bacterium]